MVAVFPVGIIFNPFVQCFLQVFCLSEEEDPFRKPTWVQKDGVISETWLTGGKLGWQDLYAAPLFYVKDIN